ncbi:HAMP domain-containing sensor histidine kinase [Gaetbulibacter aquiaggeris]|uniref:histidine kinase n=1 Tax=Gaetbulibacter aquiaggeris TaxID=1735373 RepID=A0ABW7MR14_9FLAO
MKFKSYIGFLLLRFVIIQLVLIGFAYGIYKSSSLIILIAVIALIVLVSELRHFVKRRFRIIDDFFEAVKYRDFSRWFPEDRGPKDIRFLHKGFNEVNRTIKEVNTKSEAQHVYIQKILELVEVGIIAYQLENGKVLWSNKTFSEIIDLPSFKNISFIEKRDPQLFECIFETYYPTPETLSITINRDLQKVLISETLFQIEEESFKLIVLQNIEDTLNKNESEAWKKLLSVMTHEIMNSITPIASLAETLSQQLQLQLENPEKNPVDTKDIFNGIHTIKTRSEGLLKFAKTYRNLNKESKLNLKKINVSDLFSNIKTLMEPSLKSKGIQINFEMQSKRMEIEVDEHLIEQVLINLILNAKDALKEKSKPVISVKARYTDNHKVVVSIMDNGIGIPKDIMEDIFIPFFTNKSTGSGIGLSLSKKIMMLHKGKIKVHSKEGEFTEFALIFK